MDKNEALKRYFGHTKFRPGQEQLIDGILAGRDVLGVMPTGGGKSMCYQIPALLLPGLTLVISPLISLMQDQVAALRANGVAAAYLNSSMDLEQVRQVFRDLRAGACQIIYVAPERLENRQFVELIEQRELSLIAVDEAHCISQWGQDFRPSYLKITEFIQRLPRRPVVAAFTATATQAVCADMIQLLHLREPLKVITGFDRENLFFDVRRQGNRQALLLELVAQRKGKSGIIYCATRSNVEKLCDRLNAQGIPAVRYHAGLSDEERQRSQEDFQYDRKPVMVATNAFGMGIDKSNVSFVIHYNMPGSLEAYYQEAGRAGRDGQPADCILLYADSDIATARYFIENSGKNQERTDQEQERYKQSEYARLRQMVGYCRGTDCFRGMILDYFGQSHPAVCGNCGNCQLDYVETDITVEAQMILSCVQRIRRFLGYSVGTMLLVRTLRGSREKRVLELGLNQISTYGLMGNTSTTKVRAYLEALEQEGYLWKDPDYDTLKVTNKAAEVLFQGKTVTMRERKVDQQVKKEIPKPPVVGVDVDPALLSALKEERIRIARQEQVPAYIVFSNAALVDMAAKRPRTIEEFLQVSGVGQTKAARYGDAFLQVIAGFYE